MVDMGTIHVESGEGAKEYSGSVVNEYFFNIGEGGGYGTYGRFVIGHENRGVGTWVKRLYCGSVVVIKCFGGGWSVMFR